MFIRLCAAALVIASALVSPALLSSETIPGIEGRWTSVGCELRPQANPDGSVGQWWLTREITFDENRIAAEFTTYADAGCITPVQVLGFAGNVAINAPSSHIGGAFDAVLTIDEYVKFKPLLQGFADYLNSAEEGDCGGSTWQVNQYQDVLQSGCSLFGIGPGEPTIEHEVLYVQDQHLYFSARPVDGSFMTSPEKRIHALQVPLIRQ